MTDVFPQVYTQTRSQCWCIRSRSPQQPDSHCEKGSRQSSGFSRNHDPTTQLFLPQPPPHSFDVSHIVEMMPEFLHPQFTVLDEGVNSWKCDDQSRDSPVRRHADDQGSRWDSPLTKRPRRMPMTCGKFMNAQVDVLGVWTYARSPEKRALDRQNQIIRVHVADCPEANVEA